jgi:PASTA domain
MRLRRGFTLVLVPTALVAMAAVAVLTSSAAGSESGGTDPHVHPAYGQASTVFTLTFTLRETPGHEGVMATDYQVAVAPPPGSEGSCAASQPAMIDSGAAGELRALALPPPSGGWCPGAYQVNVLLQQGPYCPPPQEGGQPVPCPEFATRDSNTGSTVFTVGPAGQRPPMATVPRLRGLKPKTANRSLRRRHLRVRYTALGNLCAGIPPHGRIIMQQPDAGARVPRGYRVLLQTSCG